MQFIDFEVMIGKLDGTEGKVGLGVFLAGISIGAQGKAEIENQSVNKIKFTIPVIFPKGEQ